MLRDAEGAEREDRWYRAAVQYRELATTLRGRGAQLLSAIAFARAATCFEIVVQWPDAARSYLDAAAELPSEARELQQVGELYNRAASCFLSAREYFNAGDAYRRAAEAFSNCQVDMIDTQHNIEPLPGGAHKFFIAGRAYSAAGDAFLGTEPAWAAMSYWQAGDMHCRQGVGYHGYVAYRKALLAVIRHRHTLNRRELRRMLPLTDAQRQAKVDPIVMLEEALLQGWTAHYNDNRAVYDPGWSRRVTDREMIGVFREFSVELGRAGNAEEASEFYVRSRETERRLYWSEGSYVRALTFGVWGLTCGFGESLWRWSASCLVILIGFAVLYRSFGLVSQTRGWLDYMYFSFLTFSNFGYEDGRPGSALGKLLTSIEILLGLLMLGMLLTYVARRVFR